MKKILTVLTFVVAVNLVFAQTKTEVTKGSTGLYKYEPAQENIGREGSVEGIIQE